MVNRGLRMARMSVGLGMRIRCERNGINWDLDLDEGIDLCIYLMGAYEPSTRRAYTPVIKAGATVFDIGANIGAHTLHFAKLTGPSGRVFAFEPTDYATSKLRGNLALNPELLPRVEVHQQFLVSDYVETLPPMVISRWPVAHEHHDLDHDHLGKPEKLANASATTADDFCERAAITHLDFVKLDVDGNEYRVLKGFARALKKFRPVILIELAPFVYRDLEAADFDNMINFVAELAYVFTDARTGRALSSDPNELRQRISPGGSMNCLLYPAEKIGDFNLSCWTAISEPIPPSRLGPAGGNCPA